MILVKCLTGPFAGQIRQMSPLLDPAELFSEFMRHDCLWEVDYSQASGIEAIRWGRADLAARAFRAMRKGLPVQFMGKVYSDPIKLEDAIVYSGRGVSIGRDDETGVEITAHDLPQPEPEPLVVLRRAQKWIEVHCQELLEAGKPVPSWQKKNAFARAVARIVCDLPLQTAGGPTVREHAALWSSDYERKAYTFEMAVEFLSREDGPIFGPITYLHRRCWVEERCLDDDPKDVAELTSPRQK